MASSTQDGWGKNSDSSSAAGVIQFRAPTMTGGPSRSLKHSCVRLAATVCMTLPRSTSSETSTTLAVLRTDSTSGS